MHHGFSGSVNTKRTPLLVSPANLSLRVPNSDELLFQTAVPAYERLPNERRRSSVLGDRACMVFGLFGHKSISLSPL
jgi:hypothetical protein